MEEEKAVQAKGEVDYTKLEADIEAKKALASQGNVHEAIDGLLNLEKQQRLAEDVTGTRKSCLAIVDILYEARDWTALNENILLLSKRRSQLKQAVQAFVRQAMRYIDQTPDKGTKVQLIKTLQSVTEGKIYVEIERARLTKKLAELEEAEGNINEAADILQEVAVETFGAMAKTEKIAYILEQVRLCLDRKDFIRAHILSKKISPRAFIVKEGKKGQATGEIGIEGTTIEAPAEGTPSLEELQQKYYQLLIRYHAHNNTYLDMARCLISIYSIPSVAADPAQWQPILAKICWYVILAPTSSDQITLLNLTAADKKLQPEYKALLQTFITKEVVWWNKLQGDYAAVMDSQPEVFGGEAGAQRRADFRLRVIEHNVLVISKYYSRIRLARLAQLLDLPQDEMEKHLLEMVVSKALHAKMDRPAGVVRFAARKEAEDTLNAWAGSIAKLLDLVEKSCRQIQKESMVHKVPIGTS